jgi:hypothetical protein
MQASGFDEHLSKPCDLDDLAVLVANAQRPQAGK